jgi:hypothetical protein
MAKNSSKTSCLDLVLEVLEPPCGINTETSRPIVNRWKVSIKGLILARKKLKSLRRTVTLLNYRDKLKKNGFKKNMKSRNSKNTTWNRRQKFKRSFKI